MADWIFLDHHARTKPAGDLISIWAKAAENSWHDVGEKWQKIQGEILAFFGSEFSRITFFASAQQAHFAALFSHYVEVIRETGRTHILTLESEVGGIPHAIRLLEKFAVQGRFLTPTILTAKHLQENLRARSSLLAFSLAHPQSGVLQPATEILALCKQEDVRMHIDVSAALGKVPIETFAADSLVIDGKYLCLPEGICALLEKKGEKPFPVAPAQTLLKALELAAEKVELYSMEVGRLRAYLENNLQKMGAQLFFQEEERLPNTVVCGFPRIHQEQLAFTLRRMGLFVQVGGVPNNFEAIAFALSDKTTQEEIDRALVILQEAVTNLFELSRDFGDTVGV